MKHLSSIILIACMALATQNAAAGVHKAPDGTIPFETLVEMLATGAHWSEEALTDIGLDKLYSESYEEEFGVCSLFVYGKNATAQVSENWDVTLTPTGDHAYAIDVALATDNGTDLYFKEKADFDEFMGYAKQSSYYSSDEYYDAIGCSVIMGVEYVDGWYVISFHGD